MTQVPGSTDQSSNFGDAVRRLVRTSAAISTPFDERDHIDWEAFTQHAKWLLKSNITSVTLFGTTGEGSSLSLTERH
ncbi:MAG: dihydrodipicolinate synthase family protein, partial [Boseongicola sp.]|nr:dihydrodipicolinate synthase family protein [Boseongicola sp.]